MKHLFRKGSDPKAPTFVLFHGTGGTENDLLPIADIVNSSASVLSVRGNVLENGMPRFFKRLAEGVFDEEDLIARTKELHEFLDQAAEDYEIERGHMIAVGYSNGANIAGSLMFHYEQVFKGAILLHPMVPRRHMQLPELNGLPVFIGAGRNDPICSPQETEELRQLLDGAGAEVEVHWESHGHQLTMSEIQGAADWYRSRF
ncbi:carboxylesterase [Paenibacillus swuensis]|uniref:Carboxylesterase n=1 Tax=Paenibacillus swuensis TaxID=1178515 RepID=A0A172TMW3_9BACL|nr:alpha/beta hydrolase [Paenibacillus swuensis]ANE48405.1 carboxylesterase [Paenibacillus swuensis]